jgi:NitT/TauT family transport system substrate-binding protein
LSTSDVFDGRVNTKGKHMAKRSYAAIPTLVIATALALAACSSGNGGRSGSGDTSTANAARSSSNASGKPSESPSDAPKEPISFKVAQSTKSIAYFPINVATKMGFFEKEGLKVGDVPVLGGDSKVAAALGGGSIDAGAGVITDFFNLQKAGLDNSVVATLVNAFYVDIIVGSDFKTPASASLEDKVRALKGKKIGVPAPGGGGEAFLNYLFSGLGMTTQDITLVNLGGSGAGAVAALKTHRVDALDFPQPVGEEVVAQKAGTIYISPARGDIPALKGQAHGAVMALNTDIAKKPEAFARFVKAIADAEAFIHDESQSQKVQSLFADYAGIQDKTTLQAVYEIMIKEIPSTPVVSEQGYAAAVEFHQKAGLINGTPPTYEVATSSNLAGRALGVAAGSASPSS